MCRDKFVFGLHDTTMRTVTELLKTHLRSNGTPKVMSDVIAETKTMESCKKYQQINNRYLQRNWGTCTLDRRKNQVQKETVKWNSNMNQTHITGVVTSEGHIPTAQQMVTHAQSAEENATLWEYASSLALGPTTKDKDLNHFETHLNARAPQLITDQFMQSIQTINTREHLGSSYMPLITTNQCITLMKLHHNKVPHMQSNKETIQINLPLVTSTLQQYPHHQQEINSIHSNYK